MYVIMNSYFWSSLINEPEVTIFIVCSYLLQVQTCSGSLNPVGPSNIFSAVIEDLEKIENFRKKIDATLYTADVNYPSGCNISVLKCFKLEMDVIFYESEMEDNKNEEFLNVVHKVLRNVRKLLLESQDTETSKCQPCETFEEKIYTDFIETFKNVAQRCNRETKN
ncbi:interleukin-15 isoform X3 [Rhineura floridana]|uniref:interleukin-15 isoform X3 n=1 Tax=Rhineura floridana TaxID=261503 RepID=UPI002AC7F667|nr:interleukin-15 isoform X3 [Rhineura floridana]XP_061440857.1 interleukin-15 isoform X3 [Rhineura floridana]XP_061440859.1 interleukin-15 isoform X3 [Rhineura floridana]XP_061440860.1 interleukin-15 isoform X3 [Rhineura floridana]XP_061440861.1 interleukin-15 isoform X3 [Rhineura floridana]XP_061440862.1 interleukin-15 isoform X3 [Rhineura floridana]XP_061440863.1 interleukin-15 isoform X3 [Rhineura floridana]XP_061440864.1 interleukin-15 isoform X3 [Rhineura floridana]